MIRARNPQEGAQEQQRRLAFVSLRGEGKKEVKAAPLRQEEMSPYRNDSSRHERTEDQHDGAQQEEENRQ